jgi:hypothetical protein
VKNIAERITAVVEKFCLIDKIFSVILDNASSNVKTMETLTPLFAGYLGSDPIPTSSNPNKCKDCFVHQRCA